MSWKSRAAGGGEASRSSGASKFCKSPYRAASARWDRCGRCDCRHAWRYPGSWRDIRLRRGERQGRAARGGGRGRGGREGETLSESKAANPPMRVGLFVTCLVDLMRPTVGFAAVKLLEDAGCIVEVPAQTLLRPASLQFRRPGDDAGHRAPDRRPPSRIATVVAPSARAPACSQHYPELFATTHGVMAMPSPPRATNSSASWSTDSACAR